MLGKKNLSRMEEIRNRYYVSAYGMSDRRNWTEHEYFSLGSRDDSERRRRERERQEREKNESSDYSSSTISFSRTKKTSIEDINRMYETSKKNYDFIKSVEESNILR